MTRAIAVLFLIGLLTPLGAQAQVPVSELSVAIFSPQRAFLESAGGKAAAARLTALQSARSTEIETERRALQTQERAVEQSVGVLSEAARAERLRDLERFRLDLQRLIEDAQAELMGLQRQMETDFLATLEPIVDRVATDLGLHLLINADAGAVAWADPSLDVTVAIVERLNAATQ